MFLMADTNAIVVITPEKTSIDNAFKFLRGALFRRVERFYQSQELALLLQRNENLREFVERIKNSRVFAPETKRQICGELLGIALSIKPKIVVNRAHNAYEAQIAANILAKMARHHLLVQPEMLGFLQFDSRVTETVNAGKPFIVRHPQRKLAASFGDIANRLGYI
jgi:MinD-like ATPase involved in chromosome partitioning or flagellar assembly